MSLDFHRPLPIFDPAKGLLHNDHYHVSYVTNDIDRAMDVFRSRFGVREFRSSDSASPDGRSMSIRAVWIGAMMYEIACASGPGTELHTDRLPPDGKFAIALHHFGYLVPDENAWSALQDKIAEGGWKIVFESDAPDYCRACFVDVPELGHLLEFVLPRAGLLERLNATPVA